MPLLAGVQLLTWLRLAVSLAQLLATVLVLVASLMLPSTLSAIPTFLMMICLLQNATLNFPTKKKRSMT